MAIRYEFPSVVAKEPTADVIVRDGVGKIYARTDTNFVTPLPVYDRNGLLLQSVKTTNDGVTEEFFCDDNPVVWWRSGDYAFMIASFTGLVKSAQDSADAANASRSAAENAQRAAEDARDVVYGTDDTKVYAALHLAGGKSRAEVEAIFRALGLPGTTVDSFEAYKAILLSDGTVRAVPASVVAPQSPTITSSAATASLVTLAWTAVPTATAYWVMRNGDRIATTTNTTYRDRTGLAGRTYTYAIRAVNAYGMHSQPSAPVDLFMDPALNAPPAVKVTTWPATLPTSCTAIIRVSPHDGDAQTLALTLGVNSGSVRPTQDPSVWIFTL